MKHFVTLILAFLVFGIPQFAKADVRLNLCNQMDANVRYATFESFGTRTDVGEFFGWQTLERGACTSVGVRDGTSKRFLFSSDDARQVPLTPDYELLQGNGVDRGNVRHVTVCVAPSNEIDIFRLNLETAGACNEPRQQYTSALSIFGGINVQNRVEVAIIGSVQELGVTPLDAEAGRFSNSVSYLDQLTQAAADLGIAEDEISRAILDGRFMPNYEDLIDAFYELDGPDCNELTGLYRVLDNHPTEPRACFRELVRGATCLGDNNPACGWESPRHAAWSARFGTLSPAQVFETAKRDGYRTSIFQDNEQSWHQDEATLDEFGSDAGVREAMERMANVAPLVLLSWPPDLADYFRCRHIEQNGIVGTPESASCEAHPLVGQRRAEYDAMLERMRGN